MLAIDVEGITKRYGDKVAVDGVSMSVNEGEVFGILGPNGAGKSTLVGMLTTLVRPTKGSASVAGHDIVAEDSKVRADLGVVFQEEAVDEELTGEENLSFHGRMYGMSRTERNERIDDVLELTGLEDVRDKRVNGYSGGMKRRLEIGRGLLHDPDVLFLDEPTVGLDARTRRDTWEYIQRMNREEDVTVVLTTHYIEEAEELCDRVAIMNDGEVAAVDPPSELKRRLGGGVVVCETSGEADSEAVEEVLKELREDDWTSTVSATDGSIQVGLAKGKNGSGSRVADVVETVDSAGLTVVSAEAREPSLEEVFLEVTGSERPEGDGGVSKEDEPEHLVAESGTDDPGGETEKTADSGEMGANP